jgi:hypothetical protein
MDDPTRSDLRKVSDSMLSVARHLVAWQAAHLQLEMLLITDPRRDTDGKIRLKVEEMNEISENIGFLSGNLEKICCYFEIPFPHPEIGEATKLDRIVKYAIKIHLKAEEMLAG